jgi:hypothetical protein
MFILEVKLSIFENKSDLKVVISFQISSLKSLRQILRLLDDQKVFF